MSQHVISIHETYSNMQASTNDTWKDYKYSTNVH